MEDPRLNTVVRWTFVACFALLAFLYGALYWRCQIIPSSYLDRAWDQARAILPQFTGAVGAHFETPQVYGESGVKVVRPDAVSPGMTLIATRWPVGRAPAVSGPAL